MRIYVNEIKINDNQIKCYTDQPTEGLEPAEHMIVDSDNHAFVYMLDSGEQYHYLLFVEETLWETTVPSNTWFKRLFCNISPSFTSK